MTGADDEGLSVAAKKELHDTRLDVQKLSTVDLEVQISEFKNDLDFLEAQVEADLKSYSLVDLQRAKSRILLTRKKIDLMSVEYENRAK